MRVSLRGIRHGFVHGDDQVVRAVWDVDLEIASGEFVCLVGPSGCGKTTLLGMIAGLDLPREGEVERDGERVVATSPDVAYMLARDALLPWLTAQDNVELGLRARGIEKAERRRRSEEWLRRVHLAEFAQSSILRLSQGMRQRVAIARTLAMTPKCILMDEPFAALDAQTRLLVQQEFIELWERERQTVVFVTHDLSEAILLGDRIVLMSKRPGRIVADIRVDIPRPRNLDFPYANEGFEEYHKLLSNRLRDEVRAADRAAGA
jgi:NitT/TauT family transport system ATP-binding protein